MQKSFDNYSHMLSQDYLTQMWRKSDKSCKMSYHSEVQTLHQSTGGFMALKAICFLLILYSRYSNETLK